MKITDVGYYKTKHGKAEMVRFPLSDTSWIEVEVEDGVST